MDKPISSLMTTAVRFMRTDDTVEAVGEELRRHGLSFVPVVDGRSNIAVGILTASDLLIFQATKRDPKAVQAWEICTYKPIEVAPDTPISEVAKLMVERRIHHVVVAEKKSIKGVVSSLDFVRQFISEN